MTDLYPGVESGPAGSEAIVVNKTAAAAIDIGWVVKDTTAGTGEYDARVTTTTTTTDPLRGVAVGGDARGTYGGSSTKAAAAAGDGIQIAEFGRVKIQVDGSTSAISIGSPIGASAIKAGYGAVAAAGGYVVARALQASTGYGDYILCDIVREGIL